MVAPVKLRPVPVHVGLIAAAVPWTRYASAPPTCCPFTWRNESEMVKPRFTEDDPEVEPEHWPVTISSPFCPGVTLPGWSVETNKPFAKFVWSSGEDPEPLHAWTRSAGDWL